MRGAMVGAAVMVTATLLAAPVHAGHGEHTVIDLTFPVAGPVVYGDDWHDSRGSRGEHRAQDLEGQKLQRVHAAYGGVVCDRTESEEGLGGYSIAVCGDDGRRYAYVHLNDDTPDSDDGRGGLAWAYAPGTELGSRVERGQWLGFMGDSGNAENEVAQLHFHIQTTLDDPEDTPGPDPRLDPAPSLRAAQQRGDVTAVVAPAALHRHGGATRLETAAALSRATYARAETVIVAPAGTPHEALLAAPLAAQLDAPILLAWPEGLVRDVVAEVQRLGALSAVLIGRPGQLGGGVEADLRRGGVSDVRRLSAPDVASLSVTVAAEVAPDGADHVLLARGLADDPNVTWPDAMTGGVLAAHLRAPILLTAADRLPPVVEDHLRDAAPDRVDVLGGHEAVSAEVARRARSVAGSSGLRYAGDTRYGTSVAVAEVARAFGVDSPTAWLATGRDFPDALTAAPAAARAGAVLLLLDGDVAGGAPETDRWLLERSVGLDALTVVGGPAAVADLVARHAAELAAG